MRAIKAHRSLFEAHLDPSVQTPIVDAGPVYGADPEYLHATLRALGTCRLRTSAGNLLPVTTAASAMNGRHLFAAGDPRVNEHSVRTALTVPPVLTVCCMTCGLYASACSLARGIWCF